MKYYTDMKKYIMSVVSWCLSMVYWTLQYRSIHVYINAYSTKVTDHPFICLIQNSQTLQLFLFSVRKRAETTFIRK